MAKISTFIFVARSDESFIRATLQPLLKMVSNVGCIATIVVDASKPDGVIGQSLKQSELSKILSILNQIKEKNFFEIEVFTPIQKKVLEISKFHFGKSYKETHCFRGYPVHGSIRQFHNHDSDYILHLDSDMLFFEDKGFSWIEAGIDIMEKHEDILCVLPRGGHPSLNGSLNQGSTQYQLDKKRGVFLFKNFTSRHYLVNRRRFLNLLPMEPLWLSWREPIKSKFFGNGKMLCWESIVEKALHKSKFWRADLMTDKAWSIHPGVRCEKFTNLIPEIVNRIKIGEYPQQQAGYFDLLLNSWENFID